MCAHVRSCATEFSRRTFCRTPKKPDKSVFTVKMCDCALKSTKTFYIYIYIIILFIYIEIFYNIYRTIAHLE